ncbi:MAG: hypothetical protein A2W91_11455 [Bacteroidetes bacterium GWF2_38_335]|nr:MAG: hypothetical protein A2W91_11455 [Bacteroidetes bacterium GWF2_38_335]OFY81688.1 MAG: hypothetical protein A2281_05590 [Bacteroidetes bacterium RIFOXYA12_FULL_38_20]HBS87751.1 hypothetical protein [Bacteroidales bacterium]
MKRYLIFTLIAAFTFGFVATSCKSKNQCKQFKKKQNKKRRHSEIFQKNDARYEDFIAVNTNL